MATGGICAGAATGALSRLPDVCAVHLLCVVHGLRRHSAGAGFWRRSAFLRWQALLLLAVSIGKVFLVDVSELSQGYRILSFLGLGALLLGVSFVYQRDWLNLRKVAS